MGKIVRGAKFVEQSYVVAVPEAGPEIARPRTGELDDRFARPNDPLGFGDAPQADAFFEDEPLGLAPPPAASAAPPSVDVEQVRADARALIDAATADGETLLAHAAQRARDLVDRAVARSAQIEADAREKGHAQGVAAGREAAQAELAQSVGAMHELVESVRAQRHTVIESAEPELVNLALAIAERVVHEQISLDPEVVLANVRQALTRLVGREVVTLRVNPADLETIRQHRDSVAASSDVEHLRIVEDARVDRGGVIVETEAGTIDAKISTQLREARKAVSSGDAISVSPGHEQPVLRSPAQAS